jgi:HSP20 family molecular chaperone IbpA
MNTDFAKKSFNRPIALGVVMLLLGLLMGVAAERYSGRGTEQTVHNQTSSARVLQGGALQIPTLDMLFPGVDNPWDPFREMRDLQAEMDRVFQHSITRLDPSPLTDPFKNDPGYGQPLDVRELKDRFEVRAYLPDANTTDTKVQLEGNRLQVEVNHRQATSDRNTNAVVNESVSEDYTEVAELPGKLQSSGMKVEQRDHDLLIIIPKAT